MRIAQEKVEQFHEKMAYPVSETPTLIPYALAMQRYEFILEELNEYQAAVEAGDLVGIADALADIAYVLLGTAVVHGIQLDRVFDEVHRSNMTKDKLDPVTKKGGKGPGYQKPRIAEVLLVQRFESQVSVGRDVPGGGAV